MKVKLSEKNYVVDSYERDIPVKEYVEKYVKPDVFIQLCKQCPNYGNVWSCPPYDFDVMDYWLKYENLKLTAYKITYRRPEEIKSYDDLAEVKEIMQNNLKEMEKEYPGSVLLSAGSCSLCAGESAGADLNKNRRDDWCARAMGKPCVRPAEMRHSVESIGGDVVSTLKDLFGLEILWAEGDKVPDYHILLGGLLMK